MSEFRKRIEHSYIEREKMIDAKLLRPSSAQRWLSCSASLKLQTDNAALIPERDNAAAARGRMLHDLAFKVLLGEDTLAGITDTVERDSPEWLAVSQYVNYVTESKGQGRSVFLETKVQHKELSGTADAIVFDEDFIEIIDFKTGRIPVEPKDNLQLLMYAYLVSHQYQSAISKTGANAFKFTIVQYGQGGVKSVFLPFNQITPKFAEVSEKIEAIKEQKFSYAKGDYCQYCPALAFCPEKHHDIAAIQKEFKDTPINKEGRISADNIDVLLNIWDEKKILSAFLDAVESTLIYGLESGTLSLPRYELRPRYGHRKWIEPSAVERHYTARLAAIGCSTEEIDTSIYTKALKSPAQLLTAHGDSDFPKDLAEKKQIGHKLHKTENPFN